MIKGQRVSSRLISHKKKIQCVVDCCDVVATFSLCHCGQIGSTPLLFFFLQYSPLHFSFVIEHLFDLEEHRVLFSFFALIQRLQSSLTLGFYFNAMLL